VLHVGQGVEDVLPGAADDDAFPQPEGEAVLDMASPFAAPVGGGEGNDGVRGDKVGDIMFAEESAFVGSVFSFSSV
jgi:hypothetical protein